MNQRDHLGILGLLIASLAFSASGPAAAEDTPAVRLLVPAYFNPAGKGREVWDTLIASADKAPITAIVNPASGPGRRVDPNYTAVLAAVKTSRLQPIGYVTLSYSKKPVAEITAEVDRWLEFYPDIEGIFFDEQPSGKEHIEHVGACFAHARAKLPKGLIVSNPGVPCDAAYVERPERPVICVFEHHSGWDRFRAPAWLTEERREQGYILRYDIAAAEAMKTAVSNAIRNNAGWVYVTDAKGSNPWNRLPTYWDEEVEVVRSVK
jgi:hypothetical protein